MAITNGYENQQKRIAFLSIHGHLMGVQKPVIEIDGKKHEELCKYIFGVVEGLFAKWPINGEIKESPTIQKTDEVPY